MPDTEFVIFASILLGIAAFHRRTFEIALGGCLLLLAYKVLGTGLNLFAHLSHEAGLLLNLMGHLLGFVLLAKQFEDTRLPLWLPQWLPLDWTGGFILLILVAILSTFLDNMPVP